ncbi:hypothetical protein ACWGCW_04325 [Streptomyces sp. NPDC054933]
MTKPKIARRYLPTSPFKAPATRPLERFALGNRVTHDEYGLGRVIGIEGEVAVLVDFGSLQLRITSPFSKMTKL